MKAILMTVLVVDFDDTESEEGADFYIENGRYPNHCISPSVIDKSVFDIGEWDEESILNKTSKTKEQVMSYLEGKKTT